jgi:threonine aldolase
MKDRRASELRVKTRSEWVSVATDAMWKAMQEAEIGWPHRREDPYVNRLEEMVARARPDNRCFVPAQ